MSNCGCGSSGCNACCNPRRGNTSFLKFSATIPEAATEVFFADSNAVATASPPIEYPAPQPFTVKSMSANVPLTIVTGTLVLELRKNGVVVATITYGGTNPFLGVQRLAPTNGIRFAQGDLLSVTATSAGGAVAINAQVVLAVRP